MTGKTKKTGSRGVTLVDRPLPFSKQEIEDAQNSMEELVLDEPEPLENPFLSEDEAHETLSRVEKALEKTEEAPSATAAETAAVAEESEELSAVSPLDEVAPLPFPNFTQETMDPDLMASSLEALLFVSDKSLSVPKIRELLGMQFSEAYLQSALDGLQNRYLKPDSGLSLVRVNGGYQMRTKLERAEVARRLARVQKHRLSKGSMETLSIIAYRQPVMREEIDKIRGVDSSHFLRILMEKKLIEISGRSELPGRPILYTTSVEFLEIFGIKDLQSLPPLKELESMVPGSEVGEEAPELRVIRDMIHDMSNETSEVQYNPKEDDVFLSEIRKRVQAIPTTTPSLEIPEETPDAAPEATP